MREVRQSAEFAQYMQAIGWQIGKITNTQFYIKKIPLLGLFIKITRPEKRVTPKIIKQLIEEYHPFAVRVDYSPTKTLVLNLDEPLEKVFEEFGKDTRYEIRKAEKNKVVVEESTEIEDFIKMWHQNAKKRGFWVPFGKELRSLYHSFGKNCVLLLAKKDGEPISGALVLFSGKTAAYFSAASTPKGRQVSSPYLVIWQAIQLAKKRSCTVFDFEGLKDPRDPNTKNWGGFTSFKKGFGGKEVDYPLSQTDFINPILKTGITLAKKLKLA